MSLINKMLQDLDARGGATVRTATTEVRPVAPERTSRTAIAVGAGIGVVIVAACAVAWYLMRPAVPVAPVAVVAPVPGVVRAPAPVVAAPVAPPVAVANVPPEPVQPVAAGSAVPAAETKSASRTPQKQHRVEAPAPRTAAPLKAEHAPVQPGVTVTSQQQAENAYRRALSLLQDGHVHDALAGLEQAVYAFPRHEAARQTLIGLLLENGRPDDAMRHLQLALALNPNQPQLAMLLARLQLERGGPAVATLQRTLPHAAGNADYIAFLAGVLQKQQRHQEAAGQYEAALRLQPQNGVWWMGLGISLQADKRTAEARDAYRKAQAAGLSPELQQFVERKLSQ